MESRWEGKARAFPTTQQTWPLWDHDIILSSFLGLSCLFCSWMLIPLLGPSCKPSSTAPSSVESSPVHPCSVLQHKHGDQQVAACGTLSPLPLDHQGAEGGAVTSDDTLHYTDPWIRWLLMFIPAHLRTGPSAGGNVIKGMFHQNWSGIYWALV